MSKIKFSGTAKRLTGGIAAVVILAVCLTVTTFALVYAAVSVENNIFRTGQVKLNLNDGVPGIQEDEFLFEPGMTVKRDFFIENDSTWDVYYRLYLDDVSGGLADVLDISVKCGDKVICSGTARELTAGNTAAADDTLAPGERRYITVYFYFPPEKGNEAQDKEMSFTVCAKAVQTKNNPGKLFD